MISKETPRRLWGLIGAVGVVAIVAIGWFFFISGQKSSTSRLLDQAANTRMQTALSRSKVAALRKDNEKLPVYRAQLAKLQKALPTSAGSAQFVADMQALSAKSDVTITSINVTPPSTTAIVGSTQTVAGATALPITVAAAGTTAHLERFLDLLQRSESRAVLTGAITEAVPLTKSSSQSGPTLTVGMRAFFTKP